MARIFTVMLAVMWAGLAPTAQAHEIIAGQLQIIHPYISAPPPAAKSAAGYVVIANEGTTPDRLIAVETPIAAMATLHVTDFGADGVARMQALDGLEIAGGEIVTLEPGGMHVMLMGLTAPLKAGDTVPATLVFEHAGRVEITFMVDDAGMMDDMMMDHSTMDHSTMDHGTAKP